VTCSYTDKPLSSSEPGFLEIIDKAIRHCGQKQSVPGLVPVGKLDERRLQPKHQVDKKIPANK
jgi:hypothetical protein